MHTLGGRRRQSTLLVRCYIDEVNTKVLSAGIRFVNRRIALGECHPLTVRRPTQTDRVIIEIRSDIGQLALRSSQRRNKVDSACFGLGLAHKCDESTIGRPGRDEKCSGMVGKLDGPLLPNLLDVKIELELLFRTKPREDDLIPIGRKAGCDLKPGKGCEGCDD